MILCNETFQSVAAKSIFRPTCNVSPMFYAGDKKRVIVHDWPQSTDTIQLACPV